MVVIGIFCFQFSWFLLINYDYSDGPYSSVSACEVTNVVLEWCFVSKISN